MSPPTQPNSNQVPTVTRLHSTQARPRVGIGTSLVVVVLLIALIGTLLEYFGVFNLIPDFGRRGRPYIELGVWQPAEFTDVPEDFWASADIRELAQQGIISGSSSNEFRPNQPITRAELAAMLQAAFNRNPTPGFVRSVQAVFDPETTALTGGFSDISANYWAAPAIADAKAAGFFNGYADGEFRPDQPISRANALVAIARGLGLELGSATRDSLWFYRDAAQIPEPAKDWIATATKAGIRLERSEPPLLQPQQNLTRAEAAVLIRQALRQNSQ